MSLLAIIIFTNSCRSQDEDLELQTYNIPKTADNFGKYGDSIVTDSASAINNPLPADPPPKNGHQW